MRSYLFWVGGAGGVGEGTHPCAKFVRKLANVCEKINHKCEVLGENCEVTTKFRVRLGLKYEVHT